MISVCDFRVVVQANGRVSQGDIMSEKEIKRKGFLLSEIRYASQIVFSLCVYLFIILSLTISFSLSLTLTLTLSFPFLAPLISSTLPSHHSLHPPPPHPPSIPLPPLSSSIPLPFLLHLPPPLHSLPLPSLLLSDITSCCLY